MFCFVNQINNLEMTCSLIDIRATKYALRKPSGSLISLPQFIRLLTAPDNDIPTPSRKAPRALEKMPRSLKHDTNSWEALWKLSLVAGISDSSAIQTCPVHTTDTVLVRVKAFDTS